MNIGPDNFEPARLTNLGKLINLFLPILMLGAGLLFLIMLLKAGLTFITSGGEPEKLKNVSKTMMSAVIGLFIVIGSFVIIKIIELILKIKILP